MAIVTLLLGLLVPWLVGVTVLLGLHRKRSLAAPGELAWIMGGGYFVGALALTLWMRALSQVSIGLGALAIAVPLLVIAGLIGHFSRIDVNASSSAITGAARALLVPSGSSRMARWAWWALLGWIVLRFVALALEVIWQPLFPWNAWTQWATKARVWYELGRIVPFASREAWFAADGAMYFDAAPNLPPTLPLLQVWASLALGRWDDSLMNWPWWQMSVALALSTYGGLRSLTMTPLAALVVTFLVASLPLANMHVAFAGYADLPLAAFYAAAVLSFLRWASTRDRGEAATVGLLALACSQIVPPGAGWAATLLPGLVVVLLPRQGIRIAASMIGAILFGMLVLSQTSPTLFGHRLHLAYDPGWAQVGDGYFLLGSWNLLWYGAIAAALLASRDLLSPRLAPLTAIVAAGASMLFMLVAFPEVRPLLAAQASSARATLQFAPVAVIFAALAYRAFAERWASEPANAQPQRT